MSIKVKFVVGSKSGPAALSMHRQTRALAAFTMRSESPTFPSTFDSLLLARQDDARLWWKAQAPVRPFLLIFLLLLPLNWVHAQYVKIFAEIETFTHESGQKKDGAPLSVVCIAGSNEWRIDVNFPKGADSKWFFDGTNVYHSLQPSSPLPEYLSQKLTSAFGVAVVPFDSAKSNVTVTVAQTPNGHPLGDAGVNLPWLAFCSGSYLKTSGRLLPRPIALLRYARFPFVYTDTTETIQDGWGLPRRVSLYSSRALFEASLVREHLFEGKDAEAWKHLLQKLQDRQVAFDYLVTDLTNYSGKTFPLRFEFTQNEPDREWTRWEPRYSGIGRILSIQSCGRPEHVLESETPKTIVDRRFHYQNKQIDSITYRWTNSILPGTNEPDLQARFLRRIARAPSPRNLSSLRARWALGILVAVAIIPPILIIGHRRLKSKLTKKDIVAYEK